MELRILIFLFVSLCALAIGFYFALFGSPVKLKQSGFKFKQLDCVTDIEKEAMRERIFHLHRQGNTFEKIGKSLKISRSTAHKYYQQYIEKHNEYKRA